jgi:hypothetical protein
MPATKVYNVWIVIEEENLATEECREVDAPGAAVMSFGTHEAAYEFVGNLYETLKESNL